MRKLTALFVVALAAAGTLSAEGSRFLLNLYGAGMRVGQNSFTQQDRRDKAYLEVKAAVPFSGNLYLWASHGYFPIRDSWADWDKKGSFAPDLNVERKLGKRIIAGGCGFYIGYFEPGQFAIRLEAGACHVANDIRVSSLSVATQELVRAEEASQSSLGGRGSFSISYGVLRRLFAEFSASYTYAPDKVEDVSSNLGGFQVALGVGISL